MQRVFSKSQLESGIQLSMPNSPAMNLPLSVGDLQNSQQLSRQKKPSFHSISNTKTNINASPISVKQMYPLLNEEQFQEPNKSYPYSIQGSTRANIDSNNQISNSQKSSNSIKNSSLISSSQQNANQRRVPSTQNSNDCCYTGNILQLGVSYSPLSSAQISSNPNIQINNLLLASQNSNGQIYSNIKGTNSLHFSQLTSPQNNENQRQNISPIRSNQQNVNSQLLSIEKYLNKQQIPQTNKGENQNLNDQIQQEKNYSLCCADKQSTEGNDSNSNQESQELNAIKMIEEQKRMQEMANKKGSIDQLLFASKELIPQLQNVIQSMEKKEGDIFKFIETQERNIDQEFNKLIYEINLFRQSKLNQLYQCKQDITQRYFIANALCQRNLEELQNLNSDILNNYSNIILEFEEQKVKMIIQNYFQRWNEAFILHEKISKQEQLDIFKVDQTCFSQVQDQINFLCNFTLKKLSTTYIKLNNNNNNNINNSSYSSPLSKINTPVRNKSKKSLNSSNKVQKLLQSSKSTTSINQSKEKKQSNTSFTLQSTNSANIQKSFSQQIKENRKRSSSPRASPSQFNQNNINNKTKFEDCNNKDINIEFNKNLSLQPQQINQKHLSQQQQKKMKIGHNQIYSSNKPFYVSFDNKEAFKNNHDAENKENKIIINGIQTIANNMNSTRQLYSHHSKSHSYPHLICIDLKDVQIPKSPSKERQQYDQTTQLENESNEQNKQIILEDCSTFRNCNAYHETENEQQGEKLENVISQANLEKQKLQDKQNMQQEYKYKFIKDEENTFSQPQQSVSPKRSNMYDSIQRQNNHQIHIENDHESKVQGQTPNFSNKKKDIVSSPNKKISEQNKLSQENNELREFNYLSEDQMDLDDIVEKERKSRDNSINKKKQFNEMLKVVQHNQIQRNLNCETILKRVSESHIDQQNFSQISTPSHFKSNSGQITNLSGKNSVNSSHNKLFQRSEEQQMSEIHNKVIKKSAIEQILQSKNSNSCDELRSIIQKLSFDKIQNKYILGDERISQTIIKSGVENTYENILLNDQSYNLIMSNNKKINDEQYENEIQITQNNPITTEDNELIANPIKTSQNSDQKQSYNNLFNDKNIYHPFSQVIDY